MAALDYLKSRGLSAKIIGSRVSVSPREWITDQDRTYIRLNRLSLLAELAAQDGVERRMHWQVRLNGKFIAIITGEPMTKAEALQSARFRWPYAQICCPDQAKADFAL